MARKTAGLVVAGFIVLGLITSGAYFIFRSKDPEATEKTQETNQAEEASGETEFLRLTASGVGGGTFSNPAFQYTPTPYVAETSGEPTLTPVVINAAGTSVAFEPEAIGTLVPTPQFSLAGLALSFPTSGSAFNIIGSPIVGDSWDVAGLGQNVGHLYGTAYPGQGNTVLAGHVDFADGSPGPFAGLSQLRVGDSLQLAQDGGILVYQIAEIQTAHRFAVEAAYPTNDVRLTLITCSSYDTTLSTYVERLIVTAFLVRG